MIDIVSMLMLGRWCYTGDLLSRSRHGKEYYDTDYTNNKHSGDDD